MWICKSLDWIEDVKGRTWFAPNEGGNVEDEDGDVEVEEVVEVVEEEDESFDGLEEVEVGDEEWKLLLDCHRIIEVGCGLNLRLVGEYLVLFNILTLILRLTQR